MNNSPANINLSLASLVTYTIARFSFFFVKFLTASICSLALVRETACTPLLLFVVQRGATKGGVIVQSHVVAFFRCW